MFHQKAYFKLFIVLNALIVTRCELENGLMNSDGKNPYDTSIEDVECFEPTFSYVNVNEWWREFKGSNDISSVELEVEGRNKYTMSLKWGKWVHGENVNTPAGSKMRLIAHNNSGATGRTE
jgi:hypothetical protein